MSDLFVVDEKGRRVAVYLDDGWGAIAIVRIGGTMAVYSDAGVSQQLEAVTRQLAVAISR